LKNTLRPHQSRAYDSMSQHDYGQIVIPTGGGKTYIMIADCLRRLSSSDETRTIVVVAPRILLANQLSDEFESVVDYVNIAHVHSGETHHFSTTNCHELSVWHNNTVRHRMIFTTYHSLHRVLDSGVNIDTIYFDEAHNGTGKSFFESVKVTSNRNIRRYFFTATPRISRSKNNISYERGMNNSKIWGGILEQTPAQELLDSGTILPPKVIPFETDRERDRYNAHEVDGDNLKDIIRNINIHSPKILVSAPTTRIMWNMLTLTDTQDWIYREGYDILHITSKHGAYINKKKVGREEFFETLKLWGEDDNRKFIIFHYSILSEGINVPGLTHSVMLRNLPTIEMAQTIGRIIRVHKEDRKSVDSGVIPAGCFHLYQKSCGQIVVPQTGKYGDRITKRLQSIVNYIFVEGIPPLSYV
tara:strand:+ start:425 stop:1669 length:1245 start_codon:yes stop_codon:yes gene_type:complete